MSAEVELARLERAVLGLARVSSFIDAVDALRRMLARESPGIREAVLKMAAPAIGKDLAAAVGAAWHIGIRDALGMIDIDDTLPKTPPKSIVAAVKLAEKTIGAEMQAARLLARTGAEPTVVLSKVFAAQNSLKASVTSLVNQAGNAGSTAVADAAGLATVWVAETNACVTCLAYSGTIAKPGQDFPAGRSYGPSSSMTAPVPHPPAHPHCRCTVEPLHDKSYAEALRREADRSVLRGFSLESESMRTRITAAERLLDRGVDAPRSVIAFARTAVKAGEFPTRGRP